jgi:hypothetical protein
VKITYLAATIAAINATKRPWASTNYVSDAVVALTLATVDTRLCTGLGNTHTRYWVGCEARVAATRAVIHVAVTETSTCLHPNSFSGCGTVQPDHAQTMIQACTQPRLYLASPCVIVDAGTSLGACWAPPSMLACTQGTGRQTSCKQAIDQLTMYQDHTTEWAQFASIIIRHEASATVKSHLRSASSRAVLALAEVQVPPTSTPHATVQPLVLLPMKHASNAQSAMS